MLSRRPQTLFSSQGAAGPYTYSTRGVGMVVARVLRHALKLRYWVLGGTMAGGSVMAKVGRYWCCWCT